ncbi:MAG: DUF721 domain-containing protein [Pyrinomonadaceae bacterium]|nr:DUF721 domain-containing protein [Pyrinomonadaceae bacterium]
MEQLFGALPAVLQRLDPNETVTEAVVFAAWNRSAGELLRARTVPVGFHEHRLAIAVEDKTWQRHLEDLSPQMLVKLNTILGQGSVRFIEFRIDKPTLAAAREHIAAAADTSVDLSNLAPSLVDAAGAIADEELRDAFLKSAAVYLGRQDEGEKVKK